MPIAYQAQAPKCANINIVNKKRHKRTNIVKRRDNNARKIPDNKRSILKNRNNLTILIIRTTRNAFNAVPNSVLPNINSIGNDVNKSIKNHPAKYLKLKTKNQIQIVIVVDIEPRVVRLSQLVCVG